MKKLRNSVFIPAILFALIFGNFANKKEYVSVDAKNSIVEEDILKEKYGTLDFKEGEVIVTFKEEFSEKCKGKEISSIKELFKCIDNLNVELLSFVGNYEKVKNLTVSIPLEKEGKDKVYLAIESINSISNVDFAGPNFIEKTQVITRNDPEYKNQWNINDSSSNINIINAWNITEGNNSVRVGIIDSGVCKHEDLIDNLDEGYDFHNNNDVTNDPYYSYEQKDYDYHGTHVAGIIGAVANNNKGICGIAPKVRIVPLQTAKEDCLHTTSDRIDAINYAISLWGTDKQISVLNHSIGGFGENTTLLNTVKKFPGIFVWSAGNEYTDVDNYANIKAFNVSNVISVGASSSLYYMSDFSNYGDGVNIFAPGDFILSTINSNKYKNFSGTSMAAPQVAAAAALLYSKYPNLKASEIKKCILDSAKTITYTTEHGTLTTKYLDIYQALVNAPSYASNSVAYLRFGIYNKTGSTWDVDIYNDNSSSVKVIYNKKMCFEGDARELTNLVDIADITITGNSKTRVQISENGTARFITAAITKTSSSASKNGKRYISYANGLSKNGTVCSLNAVKNNVKDFNLDFNIKTSSPSYLSLSVVGYSSFIGIVTSWKIRITNNNSSSVNISYNEKMCFEMDAKDFDVSHEKKISISKNSYCDVDIKPNGTARFIVASVNYAYNGVDIRRITYANELSKNKTIGTNLHSCYYVLY